MTLCVGFSSSAMFSSILKTGADFRAPAIPAIAETLDTNSTVATLGLTTYLCGFAIGPLIWAPLSEEWGRRPVYLISWFVFTVFQLPCALAVTPSMLIVSRFLAGTFGSCPLCNTSGTLNDIWMVRPLFKTSFNSLASRTWYCCDYLYRSAAPRTRYWSNCWGFSGTVRYEYDDIYLTSQLVGDGPFGFLSSLPQFSCLLQYSVFLKPIQRHCLNQKLSRYDV